ncbi:nitroreductase family deazaflavin-dependent oxidoreductase [Actinoplanes sp. NPDC051513]|uniref:nitroreductase family deazaflavin-dependent oxidoreductase n=1 Tax=Actinoplanes sp. NPDC051513 TaxID=3363908 RepID=UPI0037B17D28
MRLPLFFYRHGLGFLFSRRLVLVEHTGRRSGRLFQVVLEVVAYSPTGAVTVAAGYGSRSDWYRNLLAEPDTTITLARDCQRAIAHPLTTDEGAAVMLAYARRHRRAARVLARHMGYEIDGSDADLAALGRAIPFVRLEPAAVGFVPDARRMLPGTRLRRPRSVTPRD